MARAGNRRRTVQVAIPKVASPPWPGILCFGLSLAAALIVFSPSLKGTFVFDDFHLPFADPHASQMPVGFWIGGVRPVLIATYWLNFIVSGTRPFTYHVVNVLFHSATAVLLFFIYDRILEICPPSAFAAANRRWWAVGGAAIFLVHPLQTESVDYIAGRSELISGFFFFAAWLVFLRNFEKNAGFALTLKLLALGALAVLGKESAISLPGILVLTDFYFGQGGIRRSLIRSAGLYSTFIVGGLAAAVLILRNLTSATAAGFSTGIRPFDYGLTQCRVILIYVRLFLIPAGQNADWKLPFYRSPGEGAAGLYLALLCLALLLTVWLFKRDRLISFGLAAFFLMLSPTSSFVPINDALAERRMYMPIACLILALLGAVARVSLPSGWRPALAAAVLLVCSGLSWNRSRAWESDLTLWSASVLANPANSRAHFGLGSAMLGAGQCEAAAREFSIARDEDKSDEDNSNGRILWNLAEAYRCGRLPYKALAAYRSYAALNPTAAAYDQIGAVEATLSHVGAALDAFEEALKLDPDNATAYAYRGVARIAMNDPDDARTDLQHALALDPGNPIAAQGVAMLAARR